MSKQQKLEKIIVQNQQQDALLEIQKIHKKYFQKILFTEIDHAPSEQFPDFFQIQEQCLLINFSAFDEYYPTLMKIITKDKNQQHVMMACDIILAMNGQNDKAWNIKKAYLIQQKLDIDRQLSFNRAVCLKCKKSSSYYQYRLKLLQKKLSQTEKADMVQKCSKVLLDQNCLITLVLQRYFRNYFCWMYRIKLIKLLVKYMQNCKIGTQKIFQQKLIQMQDRLIHKFLQKNCNDYSGYSYLIAFLNRYSLDLDKESQWANQLHQFCEAAYFQQKSYNHLKQFIKHLQSITENKKNQKQVV